MDRKNPKNFSVIQTDQSIAVVFNGVDNYLLPTQITFGRNIRYPTKKYLFLFFKIIIFEGKIYKP